MVSVVMNQTVTAGDYYMKVTPFTLPPASSTGSTVPAYTTAAVHAHHDREIVLPEPEHIEREG